MDKINDVAVIGILLLVSGYAVDETDETNISSTFHCENGQVIKLAERCDGYNNCVDLSDEHNCETEAVLFYSSCGVDGCDIIGTFLQTQKTFKVNSKHAYGITFLAASGNHIYFRGTVGWRDKIIRIRRDGINLTDISDSTGNSEIQLKIDYITGNIYILSFNSDTSSRNSDTQSSDSDIRVCSENLTICTKLTSKFMKNPKSFALSSKYGALFWIEERSRLNNDFVIIKALMDASEPKVIRRRLNSSSLLTIDTVTERLYWGENQNNLQSIFSINFDGTDMKLVSQLSNVESLTAHSSMLYWVDSQTRLIKFCNVSDCSITNYYPMLEGNQKNVGSSILIFQPAAFRNYEKNPCSNTTCTDACLFRSNLESSCFCRQPGVGILSKNKVYCEDTTLLAVNGNYLYVIGNFFFEWRIIRKVLLELSSVSAVAYDSLNGRVILAETGEQNIYLLHPRHNELKLILSDGSGTIISMEFDYFGNNLYWINPVEHIIKVISLVTLKTMVIFKGDEHMYVPYDLTLYPQRSYMYVACLKLNQSVVIERISMSGRSENILIYEDTEAHNTEKSIKLHVAKFNSDPYLFLFDSEAEEIKYQDISYEFGTIHSVKPKFENKFSGSCISAVNRLICTEDNAISFYNNTYHLSQLESTLPLHFSLDNSPESGNGTIKIAVANYMAEKKSPCFTLSGAPRCEHLCLASKDSSIGFTCACAENFTLVKYSACRMQQHNLETEKEVHPSLANPETKNAANFFQTTTPKIPTMIGLQTERTKQILSTVTNRISSSTPERNMSFTTTRGDPMANTASENSSMIQTSNNYPVFHLLIIFGLGIIVGITAIYVYQMYSVVSNVLNPLEIGTSSISMKLINNDENVPAL